MEKLGEFIDNVNIIGKENSGVTDNKNYEEEIIKLSEQIESLKKQVEEDKNQFQTKIDNLEKTMNNDLLYKKVISTNGDNYSVIKVKLTNTRNYVYSTAILIFGGINNRPILGSIEVKHLQDGWWSLGGLAQILQLDGTTITSTKIDTEIDNEGNLSIKLPADSWYGTYTLVYSPDYFTIE